MMTILEHLGFNVFLRYEKDREEWLLGEVSIVLDHTPMGDFVEVEGPPEDLVRTAGVLGIDVGEAVRGSYTSLWQEHREAHPDLELPLDMVFDE
jgi:adenylate cyclase class 2